MIIYDGADLGELDANIMIEDIRVGPIEYNPVARARAINAGSEFVRMRRGTRTVTVTFALLKENRDERSRAIAAISDWAKTDGEHDLWVPHFEKRFLKAVCTAKPEPSYRQWWESKLRLVFTCFSDPYWNAKEEQRARCGQMFIVEGSAPPLMRITRTLSSAASNQTYSNGQESMTFRTIPAGEMEIDLNQQTAKVSGVSIMANYLVDSRFLIPRTGGQTITGEGYVYYRERWE